MVGGGCLDRECVKPLYASQMFAQMIGLKSEFLNIRKDRNQQVTDGCHEILKFDVEWIFPQVVVQVSN